MQDNIERCPCEGPSITIDCMLERVAQMPETEYLYRGIVSPGLGIIFGPAKSGKSIFTENLLLAIASGQTSFLGDTIKNSNPRVLLFSLEEYYKSRTDRNRNQIEDIKCKQEQSETWTKDFFVIDDSFPRYLHDDKAWELLEAEIVRINPSVVMIDSMGRLTHDPIEDSVVAGKLMRKLRSIAYQHNIVLIVIHHTPKLDNKPLSIASIAGSRVIGQEVDFMIGINRTSCGDRYIKDVAYRYAPDDAEKVLKFRINDNQVIEPLGYETEASILNCAHQAPVIGSDETLSEYFLENTSPDSPILKTSALYKGLVSYKFMSNPTMHEALKRLLKSGKIENLKKGEWKWIYPS